MVMAFIEIRKGKNNMFEEWYNLSLEALHLSYLLDSLTEVSSKNLNATEMYYDAFVGSYAESSPLENDGSIV